MRVRWDPRINHLFLFSTWDEALEVFPLREEELLTHNFQRIFNHYYSSPSPVRLMNRFSSSIYHESGGLADHQAPPETGSTEISYSHRNSIHQNCVFLHISDHRGSYSNLAALGCDLWAACLARFQGGNLPCNLTSLMSSIKVIDFLLSCFVLL